MRLCDEIRFLWFLDGKDAGNLSEASLYVYGVKHYDHGNMLSWVQRIF